ncbi:MAG TPA: phosphatase PAP2 family protein [Candidatus Kapabacteria bacterium]|nr:phosphatase PAP2 family protein [Candidatus Kapabacteria bacterium]HPO63784.1 phosphatase PAP2 family protein [Candidatus Kapabacteria bacterium]
MKKDNIFYKIFQLNPYFFSLYIGFLILGLLHIIFQTHGSSVLWLNQNHSPVADFFIRFYTHLGDGIFYAVALIIFIIHRTRIFIIGLLSFLISGGSAQAIKHIFNTPRPKLYFVHQHLLHFVPGVDVYSNYSLPSGHTATAFSLFLLLSFMIKFKPLGIVFFLMALGVGLSRLYLLQHFFIDIYVGSIIGVLITIAFYYLVQNSRYLLSKKWMDRSLFRNNLNSFYNF